MRFPIETRRLQQNRWSSLKRILKNSSFSNRLRGLRPRSPIQNRIPSGQKLYCLLMSRFTKEHIQPLHTLLKPPGHMRVRVPFLLRLLHFSGRQRQSMLPIRIDMQFKWDAFCCQAFRKTKGIPNRNRMISGRMPYKCRGRLFIRILFQAEITARPRLRPRKHLYAFPVCVFTGRDYRIPQNQSVRSDHGLIFLCKNTVIIPVHTQTLLEQVADPAREQKILSRMPLHSYGDTTDLGALACFLCGSGAGYITGQDFAVDGGALAFGY